MSDILNKGLDFLLNSKTRDIWQNTITIMLIMLVIMFLLITISKENSPYNSFVVLFCVLYAIILAINLMYVISKFLSIDAPKTKLELVGFTAVSLISITAFLGLPIISMVGLNTHQSHITNGVFILLFIALLVFYLLTFTLKDNICGNKYIDIFNMFCRIPNEKEKEMGRQFITKLNEKKEKEKRNKQQILPRNFINKLKEKAEKRKS